MAAFTVKEVLGLLLRYGQTFLVYPSAFQAARKRPPMGWSDIPYTTPYLKTPDGINLACFLFPQTRVSLNSRNKVESTATTERVGLTEAAAEAQALSPQTRVPLDSRDEVEATAITGRVELTEAAAEARATVIFFHGNAMHNYELFEEASVLFNMKCNVFLLSYRGYGFSSGKPTEKGVKIDAQTALDYILSQPYLAHVPIILFGHSLGGAVAIDLASRNPSHIASVIVSNTFTSIPDVVHSLPIIGSLSCLCTQKWRSIDKLRLIPTSTPILMISGRRDQFIPPSQMNRLWEAAQRRGIPARNSSRWFMPQSAQDDTEIPPEVLPGQDQFIPIADGDHNSTPYYEEYFEAVGKFIDMIGAQTQDRPRLAQADTTNRAPDRRWRYDYPYLREE